MKFVLRRRRLEDSKHVNHERWLLTYSDLITLLLIFFIVMFSMSTVDQQKYRALAQTMTKALHGTSAVNTVGQRPGANQLLNATSKNQAVGPTQQQNQALDKLYQEIVAYITQHHLQSEMSVVNQQRGVQITLKGVAFFNTASADVRPDALRKISGLVPLFKSLPNAVVVEGYTDNQPIDTAAFPSNWELSAMRAMSVVHFLLSEGIAPSRLSGVGYGAEHPVAPNDTSANRQKNRRVNIVILRHNPTSSEQTVAP